MGHWRLGFLSGLSQREVPTCLFDETLLHQFDLVSFSLDVDSKESEHVLIVFHCHQKAFVLQ